MNLQRKTIVIEASREAETVKIGCHEEGSSPGFTIIQYGEVLVSDDNINRYKKEVLSLLNRANQRGQSSKDILNKLKITGRNLFDEIFSVEIKKIFHNKDAEDLVVNIDDNLVDIPWELLYDGSDFLCLRFNMGRRVKTKQAVSQGTGRPFPTAGNPVNMLILADPKGDLDSAYEEGRDIKEIFSNIDGSFSLTTKTTKINSSYVVDKMREHDIVHYAGHSDYDSNMPQESGWLLKDRKLSTREIIRMSYSGSMPLLVFANSCQSGQTEEWKVSQDNINQIFGMANAFLLTGVHHFLGTFWEIHDKTSSIFASAFYRHLGNHKTIGESVRLARVDIIEQNGCEDLIWASYMLYGAPGMVYFPAINKDRPPKNRSTPATPLSRTRVREANKTRHTSESIQQKSPFLQIKNLNRVKGALIILLAISGLCWYWTANKKGKPIDEWKSPPLVISLLDVSTGKSVGFKEKGGLLLTLLSESIARSQRVQLVDRKMIQKVLEELKLNESHFSDPKTALKVGRLIGARFIGLGSFIELPQAHMLTLKLVETETSSIVALYSESFPPNAEISLVTAKVAENILKILNRKYPLRGTVISVKEKQVTLDLGKSLGVKRGLIFSQMKEENVKDDDGKILGAQKKLVGTIEIEKVLAEISFGNIVTPGLLLKEGDKVESIFKK